MSGYSFQKIIFGLIILLFLSFTSKGQHTGPKGFSQQLSIITENDRYLFQGKDGYYTNGLIINYSRVHRTKNTAILKQVNQYEIGQKIFTPYSRKIYVVTQIDRPVTGYLYAKFSRSNFIAHNQLWQWGVSVGTIGKASLGEALQDAFHKMIHVNSDWWGWIWDYQLKSNVGINLHGQYARGLLNTNTSSFLQITPVTQATLGTSFTNVSQGLLLQVGKFNLLHQSAYWNASVQDKQVPQFVKPELFFYYYPEVLYQLYNATVQGGLFRKEKGPITSSIKPFVVMHQIGALFAQNRYTLRLGTTFQTKEARSQRYNHSYGSIHIGYRFN
ncbi:MAG: lipid A deacylase LpxR family protein [Flavisolibacter sp.]|nr:lipid A deacylase LpxR family protein [Flavisolibacter sp.]